ncbi:transposase [Aquibium microcysteis]|uniref:transposase n=1 Tax=Aquibium microcysteis TaxID=675281 RepID=UPI00165D1CFB|nr:transposase [Aquibium microcysteis]
MRTTINAAIMTTAATQDSHPDCRAHLTRLSRYKIRRFEVINGAMGRRRWSPDDRARILEETLAPGAVVSAVARRYDLTPQQLFTWRREARKRAEADAKALASAPIPLNEMGRIERVGTSAAARHGSMTSQTEPLSINSTITLQR